MRRTLVFMTMALTAIVIVTLVVSETTADAFHLTNRLATRTIYPVLNGWRAVESASGGDRLRILAKAEAEKTPRLKVERIVGNNIYLVCEYVKSDYGSFAQKFDPYSGMAVAYLSPTLFAPTYTEMLRGEGIEGKSEWVLHSNDKGTLNLEQIRHLCLS